MNQKVQSILGKLKKNHGAENIQLLGANQGVKGIQRISTGCYTLDKAIGGGIPLGRITQIYGPESCGKSTTCLQIIAQFQKAGKIVGYIDTQFSLDPIYAQALGVNINDILLSQPDDGETAFNVAIDMAENGVDLIIMDSVAALVPKVENEADMASQQMGLQARLIGKGLRKCTKVIARNNTALVFTNQLRLKIGVLYGNPETTTGGKALPYFCSIRISLNNIGNVGEDSSGEKVSRVVRARIVKNKTFPPFKIAEFTINFGTGIDNVASYLEGAFDYGIFEKVGSWIKIYGQTYCQGFDNLKDKLEQLKALPDVIKAIEKVQAGATIESVKKLVTRKLGIEEKTAETPKKKKTLKDLAETAKASEVKTIEV